MARLTKTYRPWDSRQLADLRAWVAAGLTHQAIADRTGRTLQSIRRKCAKMGLESRGRLKAGSLMRKVKSLWAPGTPDADIAEQIGCSPQSVYAARKRLDLPCGTTFSQRASVAARWKHFRAGRLKTLPG